MLMLHNLSSFVHRILASQVQKLNAHVRRLRNLWKHLHKFLSRSNIFWPFYFFIHHLCCHAIVSQLQIQFPLPLMFLTSVGAFSSSCHADTISHARRCPLLSYVYYWKREREPVLRFRRRPTPMRVFTMQLVASDENALTNRTPVCDERRTFTCSTRNRICKPIRYRPKSTQQKTPFSAINVRMLWMRVTAQRNVTYF